ncbi:PBP1A family penicillin-binding protein [Candidatus Uhrbacteria bacterium]|jgi:1A family penicillin-binding protein|nr:PBP1A family penicillin-binding protein [Candidatus Uhrbacteria bacterium]
MGLKKKLGKFKVIFSRGFLGNVLLFGGVCLAGGVVVLGLTFLFIGRDLPDPNALQERSIAQSTKIMDRTGEHQLFEIFIDERRTLIKLDEIPQHLVDGVIATEDTRFYEHKGIRPLSIARAVFYGVFTSKRISGTSTLTQQLVKNAILTDERSITRKLKEAILSVKLEQRYTKDEILQIYFNEIPYGSTNYGVEAASRSYFAKSASELSLSESAVLAGLPKAPTAYLNNPDALKTRRDFVLRRMFEEGYITEEEKNTAQADELVLERTLGEIDAPHFVFYVKQLLEDEFGQRAVEEGGLTVITTLDYDLQGIAQEAVTDSVAANGESLNFSNAALVAIDPANGQVLSMVGSHDYFDEESDGAVNVTTRSRQPGSSMKPLAYTALFEAGYTPNTVFYDVETDFPSDVGTYHPRNYDLSEHGPVTVRKALQGSLNITAVKALYMVGVSNFLDFADRMGYTTLGDRSRFGLSVVLGGGEVTLLEHTNAYATFANDGVRNETVAIMKIEDAKGEVLFDYEEEKKDGSRVLDENISRMITNVLSDDGARQYAFGGGSQLQLGGRPVAAKTGTTNDYRDGWTLGYTPQIAIGVWGGNNDNTAMARGAGGSSVAAPIWNKVMRGYLADKAVVGFPGPNIPNLGKPALDGELGSSQTLLIDRVSGKLATDETPVRLRDEKTFVSHHSILHYVDRADKLGAPPLSDSKDPQYQNWESAVQDWVTRQEEELGEEFVNEEPPTEYDDVHTAANVPDVDIESPRKDDTLENREVEIRARVSARRPVSRVEAYIDGFYLGGTSSSPYVINAVIPGFVQAGDRNIRVVAFDDMENEGDDIVRVNVPGNDAGSIQVVDPRPGQIIVKVNPTYSVKLELDDPAKYEKIDFFLGPRGGGGTLTGSIIQPAGFIETFTWNLPEPGEYILSAVAVEAESGNTIQAGNILLEVEDPAPEPPPEGEDPETEE